MKKLTSLALLVSCIFTFIGCSENEADDVKAYFEFAEQTNIFPDFDADGGTSIVSFKSSHNWTASSDQSWISLSRTSGTTSNAYFTITVSENTSTSSREGEVVIKSNNKPYKIFVSQKGKDEEDEEVIFTLSSTSSTVSAEGGDISLTLKHDVDVKYIEVDIYDKNDNKINWIKHVDTRTTTTELVFSVSENISTSERVGVIKLKDTKNGLTQKATITQKGAEKEEDVIFTLSPSSSTVSAAGGDISLTLKHDVDIDYVEYGIYDANGNKIDWIKFVNTRTNTTELIFSVSENTSTSERVGVIKLTDTKNGFTQKATITQKGAEEVIFTLSPASSTVSAEGGDISLTLKHDAYHIEYGIYDTNGNEIDWIEFVKTRTYTNELVFTVSKNTSTSERVGIIFLYDTENDLTQEATITQEGADPIFTLNPSSKTVQPEGGEVYLTLKHDVDIDYIEYGIFDTNDNPIDWIELTTTRTNSLELIFTISKNTSSSERVGVIKLMDTKNGLTQKTTITQKGLIFTLSQSSSSTVSASGGYLSLILEHTVNEYYIEYDIYDTNGNPIDWMHYVSTRNNITEWAFYVSQNTSSSERVGVIKLMDTKNGITQEIAITQKGADGDGNVKSVMYYTSSDGNVVYVSSLDFNVDIESNTYSDGIGMIIFDGELKLIGQEAFKYLGYRLTSIEIPDGVSGIAVSAFEDCRNLTSVDLPNSLIMIGDNAFHGCSSLTSIDIPDGVKMIGDAAFFGCDSMTYVNIPDGLAIIGDEAFMWCGSLTSVNIPGSVISIGEAAFGGCSSLTSVYCRAITPPQSGYQMFDGNGAGRKIYVPMESVEAYKNTGYWDNYSSAIKGYNF